MSYDVTVRFRRFLGGFSRAVDTVGEQALFYGETFRYIPNALTRYRKETIRNIAEMTMGTGALVMIGGTVGVAAFLTLASGGVIAVQGYSSLGNIGIEALTGFLSAFINVRIAAPVVAGIGLAATFGAGVTAQLGAMRINEEIDALESMGIRPIEYLVSTRLVPLISMSRVSHCDTPASPIMVKEGLVRSRPVIGMPGQDGHGAIDLFAEKCPGQQMRPGLGTEGQAAARLLARQWRQAIGAANHKHQIAGAGIAQSAQHLGKILGGHAFAPRIQEHDMGAVGQARG